jgi:outer membrane lipoprotein-sorting protein
MKPSHTTRRVRAGVLLAVGVAAAIGDGGCGPKPAPKDDARAVALLRKTAAAYARLDSFSEQTTIRVGIGGAGETTTKTTRSQFLFRRPDRIYYETSGAVSRLLVSNGKRLVDYSPGSKAYRFAPAPPNLAAFLREFESPGVSELALLAGEPWEPFFTGLTVGKTERMEGATVQSVSGRIAGVLATGAGGVDARQTLWLEVKTGLIRRSRVSVRRGEQTTSWEETMQEVAANPDLPDARFAWTPPPGAAVVAPRPQPVPPAQRPPRS